MIDQAIERINAEMQKAPGDYNLETLGHYIIDRCDEALAAKIMGGKTLKGAFDAVVKMARAIQKDGMASPPPGRVFGEVDKYFGLSTDTAAQWRTLMAGFAGSPPQAGEPPQHPGGYIDPLDFL